MILTDSSAKIRCWKVSKGRNGICLRSMVGKFGWIVATAGLSSIPRKSGGDLGLVEINIILVCRACYKKTGLMYVS